MNIEVGGHRPIDLAQKAQKLLMAVSRLALGEHATVEHIKRGKQCGGAVALVVMGDTLDITKARWQHRLAALERLALALLVHAQDQGILRWVQVQPHHITQLLNEKRIGGQLKTLATVGLQAEQLEIAVNTSAIDTRLGRNRAHAPVRRAAGRFGVQALVDQLGTARSASVLSTAAALVRFASAPIQLSAVPSPSRHLLSQRYRKSMQHMPLINGTRH